MTEQLQQAIEALQRLPSDAQDTIAARILEEIEEQEWDAIVSKPHVQALAEDGETEDSDITPSIATRLEAARYAQDLGYEVRVRVDPILTIEHWEEHYADFVAQVKAAGLNFRYWTLGTYREKNTQLDGWRERW